MQASVAQQSLILELQLLDNEIMQANTKLKSLPEIEHLLHIDKRIITATDELAVVKSEADQIALELRRGEVEVSVVKTLTLGSHGETMVPVPSRCTVNGKALSDVLSQSEISELVDKTRNGGAEIVALLKTGSAYYAPSAAAARMAKAVITDSNEVMPVCAWVNGEYGISGVYLGVEAQIGKNGITKVMETNLTSDELSSLKVAAEAVRAKQADVKDL